MFGFLVLIFLYLFAVLARNTEKPARSSLVRSLILAGLFLLVLSVFSVVTVGVLFLLLLFIPFFFFPSNRSRTRFHFKQDDAFKDLFEHMRRQQNFSEKDFYGQQKSHSVKTPPKGMSVHDAANILGVSVEATTMQVKSAYRKLMLKHHPDKGGSVEHASKLNIARDVMMAYLDQSH